MSEDEESAFTEDEFREAFRIVTTPSEARRWAREMKEVRSADDLGPVWQLAPDVLDLLSLVSADCASRVAAVLRLSPEEAQARRRRAADRFGRQIDY